MRSGSVASVLLLSTLTATAHAEPIGARLVRTLDAPGTRHPFADRHGRIPVTALLPPGASAATFGLFPVAPGVGGARLSPVEVASISAAHPEIALAVAPPLHPLLDVSGKWTRVNNFRNLTGLTGKGVLVGVVDTGLDVRHPDFLDASGKTRVAWLLLAGAQPAGVHADLEEAFGCTSTSGTGCAIFSGDEIDALIAAGSTTIRDREGHGTHVTSIAAGNGGLASGGTPRFVGMAPDAQLIVAAPAEDGGFYDADILNASRFVFDRAAAMGKPVVLNLSLGGDYGSHDGLSALEQGLSALVGDDKPGRAIVVAAGNSGDLTDFGDGKGPYGIHTEVHVSAHEEARVPIVANGAIDGQAFVWITFRKGDVVDVALEGPGGDRWIGFTSPGHDSAFSKGTGNAAIKAGVVNNLPASNPSITADTNSAAVVWTGRWDTSEFAVVLRGEGDASLWITGTGDASGGLHFARSIRQGTINMPASAPSLLAVGCTLNRISWKPLVGATIQLSAFGDDSAPTPDGACFFSAAGPTPFGVQKPEISAPGGFVGAAMSADADPRKSPGGLFDLGGCPDGEPSCTVLDQTHALAAGTSMSAPHVTGAIALLMELDPTLTQARVTEILQAGARRPTGHVFDGGEQLGPGALDLVAARDVLLETTGEPVDPDLGRSWYTMSSSYARPDPTWPVWGTIELRRADGKIAGGIDGQKLTVDVTGGDLYQPLTRVRAGLFRFAVAGRSGDVGGQITVQVAYDGAALGTTTLPVGHDSWSSNDRRLDAVSGACHGPARPASGGGAAAIAIAIGAIAARRSRRRAR